MVGGGGVFGGLSMCFEHFLWCVRVLARWPSGLRRYVQVVVFSGGVGSNPTLVIPLCSHPNLPLEEFVLCVLFLFLCKGGWARVHMLVERTTQAITPQAPVAQWLRRQTSNLKVAGSTPVGSVLLFFHTLVLCLGSVLQQHTPNPFVCKVSEFVTHPHSHLLWTPLHIQSVWVFVLLFFGLCASCCPHLTMDEPLDGRLAQMVERSLSMREVLGSMPKSSTVFYFYCLLRCFGVLS